LPHRSFTPEAISALQSRQWRGNVRELENTIRMLMSLCDKRILDADDLESLAPQRSAPSALRIHQVCTTRVPPRPEADRGAILAALDACNWNQSLTSRHLGVHRNTLRNMMKRLDIRVRHLAE
jgi:DNA-binding NtrC family response regulator